MIDDDGFDFSVCVMSFNSPHGPFSAGLLCAQVLHYILPWAVRAPDTNEPVSGHRGSPTTLVILTNECVDKRCLHKDRHTSSFITHSPGVDTLITSFLIRRPRSFLFEESILSTTSFLKYLCCCVSLLASLVATSFSTCEGHRAELFLSPPVP